MTHPADPSRAHLREPGSVILRDFRAAMEARRHGGLSVRMPVVRSFAAAEASPFTAGLPGWDASINALLLNARPVLVTRARHWARNTGPGRRFLDLVRNGGVGPTGYTLQMRCGDWRQEKGRWVFRLDKLANDAIERAWLAWCQRGECEATGRLSFADVCRLQLDTCARDGEYLARHLRNPGDSRFKYRLQLLQTDRLDHHHNVTPLGGGPEVRMGVHRDSMGRPVAYSLLRGVPNDGMGRRDSEVVGAAEVLHDFVTLDAEQARGVPWSHATLVGGNMLARFTDFAMYAAQVGASQQGFIEQQADTPLPITPDTLGTTTDTDGERVKELAPGAIDWLPPGAKFAAFTSQYPSQAFDPFVSSFKHDIAAGVGVAYHNLTGDMTKVNYSSARIAELAERDHWRGIAHWFIGSFVFPVFRSWLEMALLSGQVTLASGQTLDARKIDKYLAGCVFRGRGWDWVDPQKEVAAYAEAVRQRFTTRSQVVAAKGGDYEDNCIELAQEREIELANGIDPAPVEPAKPAKTDASDTTTEGKPQ